MADSTTESVLDGTVASYETAKESLLEQLEQMTRQEAKVILKKKRRSSRLTSSAGVVRLENTTKTVEQQQKLKEMEENQARMEQEMEAELLLNKKKRQMKRALEVKRMLLEQQMREEEEREEVALQEKILRESREQVKRMKARRLSFQDEMAKLGEDMKKLRTERGESTERFSDISQWKPVNPRVEQLMKGSAKKMYYIARERSLEQDSSEIASEGRANLKKKESVDSSKGPNKASRSLTTLSLPTFSGKPEEWPLFFSSYQISNELCGYSDAENLLRLQASLKGSALEIVRGQLLQAKSIPRIIDKLRQLYGRPEQILQSLWKKVRKLQPSNAGQFTGYITFSSALEQLCGYLESAGLKHYMDNTLLIQELVDKLPDSEKREWVRYKRRKKTETTLRTFADFVSEIVEDVCEGNIDQEYQASNSGKCTSESRSRRSSVFKRSEAEGESESYYSEYCFEDENNSENDSESDFSSYRKVKTSCNVSGCKGLYDPILQSKAGVVGTSAHIRTSSNMLFRMIPVKLHFGKKSTTVLAFLDEGASVTLVEKAVADRLGVIGVREKLTIKWTTDIIRVETESRRMNLWVSSAEANEKLLLTTVRTVQKLMLANQVVNAEELFKQHEHLRGLPISSYSGRPEMIIGLNNLHAFASMEAKAGAMDEPIAVQCRLGWTVYGPQRGRESSKSSESSGYLGVHQEVVIGEGGSGDKKKKRSKTRKVRKVRDKGEYPRGLVQVDEELPIRRKFLTRPVKSTVVSK